MINADRDITAFYISKVLKRHTNVLLKYKVTKLYNLQKSYIQVS